MSNIKPAAGALLPAISANSVSSGESMELARATGRWQLVVVYRGKHCGRCKKYLKGLQATLSDWSDAGFDVVAVSADSRVKAQADVSEMALTFPVACEMSEASMREWGLYISDPLSPDEADARFAEPAVFCLRPDGTVQIAAISNGPAARPDLAELLDGMVFTIDNDRPARGMA